MAINGMTRVRPSRLSSCVMVLALLLTVLTASAARAEDGLRITQTALGNVFTKCSSSTRA